MTEATPEDIDCFNKCGYMVVKNAFSRLTAELCRDKIWDHIKTTNGIDRHDQSTWVPKVRSDKIWDKKDGAPWANIFTDKLLNAIDSLIGPNQAVENFGAGWWTITFPGFSELPWGVDGNWHVDGNRYQHYPFSKEVGIIPMMLFSDVLPSGGGTAIAEGSHLVASQVLADVGLRGCSAKELSLTVLQSGVDFDITEITGEAGDVILLHPFLLHSRSKNLMPTTEEGVRFLCHPSVPLKSHMDLTKPFGDLSVLEASIVRAVAGEGDEEKDNTLHMQNKENSSHTNEINIFHEKIRIPAENDEHPSHIDELHRKGEENKNSFNTGNISHISNESNSYINSSNKSYPSAPSRASSSSNGKNSEYYERRRLLGCISPEACREFAMRRKANKNKHGNRFNDDEDEDKDEESEEGEEEEIFQEFGDKQLLEKIEERHAPSFLQSTGNKMNMKQTDCSHSQECSFNQDYIPEIIPEQTIDNFTSLQNDIGAIMQPQSDLQMTSSIKNSNVEMKKRKREKKLLSDSSKNLLESIMGFENFKTSYRR